MNLALQLLGSAVVAATFAAIVTGLFGRKKLSAEATDLITKAASGVVERLEGENTRIVAQVSTQRTEIDDLKRERQVEREMLHALGEVLNAHASWDRQAVEACQQQGIILPPPPPLSITEPGS